MWYIGIAVGEKYGKLAGNGNWQDSDCLWFRNKRWLREQYQVIYLVLTYERQALDDVLGDSA